METTNLPSPSERLEHYKLAIEALRENEGYDDYGLCIVLGDIAHSHFFIAPWECFYDLQIHYPELTEPYTSWLLHTEDCNVSEVLEAIQERITILERAIVTVEKLIKK